MSGSLLNKKSIRFIAVIEALIVAALSILALHDTNTATGAGYSLFLHTGVLSRSIWDLVLELALILIMLILLIVPAVILKADPESAALFFLSVCGFSVYLRPDRFIAPFTNGEAMLPEDVVNSIMSYLPIWIVCISVQYLFFMDAQVREFRFLGVMAAVSACCILIGSITPAFEIFLFASGYFLNIPVLTAGKRIRSRSGAMAFMLIPATVLCLHGVWRLFFVLSTYHM